MAKLEYPVIIEPLPEAEGGGFVALVPDLPGCMSDGETAEEAVTSVKDAIAAWIDDPSLVILDVRLGNEDGLDLLREIRSRSDIPIIITTGHRRDDVDRIVGLELGADD
jgi:predicted RNase H-like HicB family nuclease